MNFGVASTGGLLGRDPVHLGLATRTSQLVASLAKSLVSWYIFARLRGRVLLDAGGTLSSPCGCLTEPSFIFIAVFLILLWAPNNSDYTTCGTFHVLWK